LHDTEDQKPYGERREHEDLERSIVPTVREAIVKGGNDTKVELTGLDLERWTGRTACKSILTLLRRCPTDALARQVHEQAVHNLVKWWGRDRGVDQHENRSDFEFEHDAVSHVAAFVLKSSGEQAIEICAPLVQLVERDSRELAQFLERLILAEDHLNGTSPFWAVWQQIADAVARSRWVANLGRGGDDHEHELLRALFLGIPWRDGIRHWRRLDGATHRLDRLFLSLPFAPVVLQAYSRYLHTVGGQSLPQAFVLIAQQMKSGPDGPRLITSTATFFLEAVLRRYVYGEPLRAKSDPPVREAILFILDALVEAGSSAAYKMRDDFVTPLAGAAN